MNLARKPSPNLTIIILSTLQKALEQEDIMLNPLKSFRVLKKAESTHIPVIVSIDVDYSGNRILLDDNFRG